MAERPDRQRDLSQVVDIYINSDVMLMACPFDML